MIDKARQAVSALEMSAVKDMSVEKAEELRETVYQSLDQAEKFENLMSKHNIKSVEELEHIILNNATGEQSFSDFVKYNVKPFLTKKVNFQTLIPIIEKGWTWEDYMDEENDRNTGGKQFADERLTKIEFDLLKEWLCRE